MFKLTILACLAATTFGLTNHFIDSLSSTSAVNFPYPVNMCNRVSLTASLYKRYDCSTDKKSIKVTSYTDSTCTKLTGTNMTYESSTGQGANSWTCSGEDYYSSVQVFLGSCAGSAIATTNYAVDVCYLATNGNYSIAECSDDEATIKSYASSKCTGTVLSTLSTSTTCGLFTKMGVLDIYAKLTSCMGDESAAYIPSVMGAIVFLVFNIVYLF